MSPDVTNDAENALKMSPQTSDDIIPFVSGCQSIVHVGTTNKLDHEQINGLDVFLQST